MGPRRVYCIRVTGGCRHRSLTSNAGDGVSDVVRRCRVLVVAGAAALLGTGCAQARREGEVSCGSPGDRRMGPGGRGARPGGAEQGPERRGVSVSCPSPGNCAAGGNYRDGGRHQQGFVVSEMNGRWRQAIEAPGLGALNKNGTPKSARYRAPRRATAPPAGTTGTAVASSSSGFVVSEQNGRWHRAVEVPGLGALNKGGNAEVSSVSCAARATARPSGPTGTAAAISRGSWPSRGAASGAGRSRCLAWGP